MMYTLLSLFFFFFNDTATPEIYPLSLHDALPISTFATRSRVSGAPSACSVINRSSPWPRACGGPGSGSRASPSPQSYNRPPCPPEEGAGLRGQADPCDDRRGASRECGRLTLLTEPHRRAGSFRSGHRTWTSGDRSRACARGSGDRVPGHCVPSTRPAPLGIRPVPPGGRRSALRRGGRRPRRLANGVEGGKRAAPLATVYRPDPRLQGDGGGVSAAPAVPPVALGGILSWYHSRRPQGPILPLGRPAAARCGRAHCGHVAGSSSGVPALQRPGSYHLQRRVGAPPCRPPSRVRTARPPRPRARGRPFG